ncbi:MAG: YciI family protein [Acidimicrobiales bacterium]
MKYLLMIYGNDDIWGSLPEQEWERFVAEHDAVNQELTEAGILLYAHGVADQDQAKVVRVEGGTPAVTDGPYVEAKEYIGSFYVIDVEDHDTALEVAARIPSSRLTGVEVRPIHG